MSIQAVAWALEQDIPGTAKLVLISLANRADHVTGHCWPSVERLAKEASCSPRSVHTYIHALKRNGYLDVRSGRSKTGTARTNDYWLRMDRPDGPWDFGKTPPPDDPIPDETEDQSAAVADTKMPHQSAAVADLADGISATSLQTKPSELEPSESSISESETRHRARGPKGFDPGARLVEAERLKAAEMERKAKPVFIHEGTRAWKAWQRHLLATRGRGSPATNALIDGKTARGWWFATCFPPTGPPEPGPEFADEFESHETE